MGGCVPDSRCALRGPSPRGESRLGVNRAMPSMGMSGVHLTPGRPPASPAPASQAGAADAKGGRRGDADGPTASAAAGAAGYGWG